MAAKPTTSAAPTVTTAQILGPITDQFPALADLLSIPELQQFFTDVANNPAWGQGQIQDALFGTDWWKQSPETARQWQILKLTDPQTAAQKTGQTSTKVHTLAMSMGAPYSPAQIAMTTEVAIQNGWSDQQIEQNILSNVQQGRMQAGSVKAMQGQVNQVAGDYGINISPSTSFNWAKNMVTGQGDINGFTEYAKQQAITSHPYWEKQITEGHTVRQLADPYIQQASKLLEVSPDSIDLSDPKWSFVQRDKNGATIPMSQTDWSTKLMTDPKFGWDRTDNAKQSAFQVVDQLQQTMGAK